MTATPTNTQVLVVGAGPNGLACALTLAGLGMQATIVDALPGVRYGARAALVHPRTLEVLDTIGLAEPLMELGIHSKGVVFHAGENKLMEVDVTSLGNHTQFPLTLLLPQYEIEQVFQEKLAAQGIKVLRSRKVVGMQEACCNGGLDVFFEDGAVINARYVVGADGSHSSIRSLAGIDFEDPHTGLPFDNHVSPTSAPQIVFSDIFFEEPLPKSLRRDAVSWYLNKHLLFCPLPTPPGVNRSPDQKPVSFWRVGIVVPAGAPSPPRHPGIQFFQREIDARKPWTDDVIISSVAHGAPYRVRSAVAKTFFKKMGSGHVLLVGDAAHVHSPSGGQGMNLGLCDAVALGLAIKSHSDRPLEMGSELGKDFPLIRYSNSRRKTAIKVIGMVERLTAVISASTRWRRHLRNIFLWVAGSLPPVRRFAAWQLSGLVYRDS